MPRYHLLTWNFLIKKLHVKLEFLKLEFLINKTQALMGYPKWRKSRIPYWEASHCKPDWEASHCKSINQDVDLPHPYHTTHADLNTRIFQMPNNTNNIKFQKKIIQKKYKINKRKGFQQGLPKLGIKSYQTKDNELNYRRAYRYPGREFGSGVMIKATTSG